MKKALQERSVDFASWDPGHDNMERVFDQFLSYQSARINQGLPPATMNESGEKYAKVILYIDSIGLLSDFKNLVADLRSTYGSEMKRLGLESGPWGKDDSWINWDMAKQAFFFLSKDRSETNMNYRIADPLSDEILRNEIVSRHIGWEFWYKFSKSHFIEPWSSNSEILRLLEIKSSVRGDSQTASWALAKIGHIIRNTQVQDDHIP